MNFFKKRKAAKDSAKNATVILEPADFDGDPHLAHSNGFDGGEDISSSATPKYDLAIPDEVLPDFPPFSRLSKSLEATLKDDAALSQFIQFMECEKLDHLVRFWLDAESFRITTRSRLRSELNNAQHKGISAKNSADLLTSSESEASPSLDSDFSRENRNNTSIEAAIAHSKASPLSVANGDYQTSQTKVIRNSTATSSEQPEGTPDGSAPSFSSTASKTSALKSIERDAVAIYQKYICPNVVKRIELTEESYHSIVSRICCEDGRVDPECFLDAQSTVFEEMRRRFPVFRQSEYHLKYEIDLLTGAKLTLSDILYHENALVHFMEFVEIEGGLPLLQLWLLVENFSKLLSSNVGGEGLHTTVGANNNDENGPSQEDVLAQNDAMIIYDKYFSLQATEALGFCDRVRFMVEANICTEDGKVDAKCFETPVKLVLNLLAKEYLQPFLQSSIYYRWLSELINIRRLGGVPSGGGHRLRSGSDASSSEASVSSSLQATGSAKKSRPKKREKKSVQDMLGESCIDVDDPDAIWRRKHNAGPLIFGKINPMGDYRSELGFHPDTLKKKGSSRITKALKSLVQDESEVRAREDMAAQIAQMVINDVTSLTMGKPAFEPDIDDGEEVVDTDEDET